MICPVTAIWMSAAQSQDRKLVMASSQTPVWEPGGARCEFGTEKEAFPASPGRCIYYKDGDTGDEEEDVERVRQQTPTHPHTHTQPLLKIAQMRTTSR